MDDFTVSANKYAASHPTQKQVTDAIVMFVATDLMPLSVVDSIQFRAILHHLDPRYVVPSLKQLSTRLLGNTAATTRERVLAKLAQAQSVCLTIDLWSNRQMRGFIGITGHCIINWTMESVMLACKRFTGRHTAENIRQQYEETVASFDIAEKITNIVTDKASNMTKAFCFDLPGFDGAVEDAESDDDGDTNDENTQPDESCYELLPTTERDACFAHTINLCVNDGLLKAGQHTTRVLGTTSKIVAYVRKSVNGTEALASEKRLQPAIATRWNSQLVMIKSVLNVEPEKLNTLDTVKLTAYERKTLGEVCEVLRPFEEASTYAQLENQPSASLVIPCVLGLKCKLASMKERNGTSLGHALSASVDRRLTKFVDNDTYITASVLDARFKLRWARSTQHAAITDSLYQKVKIVRLNRDTPQEPCAKRRRVDQPIAPGGDLFDYLDADEPITTGVAGSSESEVEEYLAQPPIEKTSDPLQFWQTHEKKWPNLATLASRYLAIPASSAPVERLFSVAGKVFRPERASLSDKRFEELMFIRCNK